MAFARKSVALSVNSLTSQGRLLLSVFFVSLFLLPRGSIFSSSSSSPARCIFFLPCSFSPSLSKLCEKGRSRGCSLSCSQRHPLSTFFSSFLLLVSLICVSVYLALSNLSIYLSVSCMCLCVDRFLILIFSCLCSSFFSSSQIVSWCSWGSVYSLSFTSFSLRERRRQCILRSISLSR